MTKQRHMIRRQILELQVSRQSDAWSLQQRAGQILQGLAPVIERCCDEFSSAECLYRIERLELDLGRLDRELLEQQMPERFAEALRRQLAEQIGQPGEKKRASLQISQWELFEHYLQWGRLPWWADQQRSGQPQESLDWLLRAAPAWLARSLPAVLASATALARLAGQFPERALAGLLEVLAPALDGYPLLLQETLQALPEHMPELAKVPAPRYRSLVWQSLLACAVAKPTQAATAQEYSQAVLQWLAGCLPGLSRWNMSPLRQGFLQASDGRPQAVRDVAVQLAAEPAVVQVEPLDSLEAQNLSADAVGVYAPGSAGILAADVTRDYRAGGTSGREHLPSTDVWQSLQDWLEQGAEAAPPFWLQSWPQPLCAALFARLHSLDMELAPALVQLSTWLERTAPEPEWLQSWPSLLREEFTAQVQYLAMGTAELPSIGIRAMDLAVPSSLPAAGAGAALFSDADAVYLNNAGLVILWPFLKTFFQRQSLLQEQGGFRDEAARRRGVALLQCLADGGAEPPEYLLPLNKLLCGMALDDLFELDEPLSEAETAECDALLQAAIAQAPIWRNLSIAGLRGSFLQRTGMLTARDGVWLLRVEKHTYDVVLERVPWNFNWIKLPWMSASLQVEW
jgi:hypothetical protein